MSAKAARVHRPGLGVLEISALGAALVVLDALEKAAQVRLLQAELNDYYGYVLKITGDPAALRAAIDAGRATAQRMQARCITTIIDAPDAEAWRGIESPPEHSPLINADVVKTPRAGDHAVAGNQPSAPAGRKESTVSEEANFAIGLIETQGFTAVIEAIDTACKAANVEVIGKEKLGGGYITVLIRGDVAAVKAAIDAGQSKVNGLGKLIAAHVIPRPSASVLALLPKG